MFSRLDTAIILLRLALRVTIVYWAFLVCAASERPRQPWIPPQPQQPYLQNENQNHAHN
jgi:hypothetical protein